MFSIRRGKRGKENTLNKARYFLTSANDCCWAFSFSTMAVGTEGRKRKRKVERPGADDRLRPHMPVKKAIELVKNSLSAPMELPTSLYVEANDPDFPRGGGVVPSPNEEAEARMEAEDVYERGKKDSRKKAKTGKKGSKRPPADIEDDLSSFFGNDVRFDPECPLRLM
ncbi:uncharacterized protein LOC108951893 isoform X2 [Musa acuminata AAA Group]|uniref:uncharacterized protein LOC108951893 isoform X2 n=1 Tax=Musa acuminata AAA Group TaxID=214697 RepID=UPI0031DD62DE